MKACAKTINTTLYNVIKTTAEKYPNRKATEFMGKEKTYLEFLNYIDKTASLFLKIGIKKGDKIALCLPNSPQLVASIYALNKIGAVSVLINPIYHPKKILSLLKKTDSKVILVLDLLLNKYVLTFSKIKNIKIMNVSLKDEISFTNKLLLYTLGLPKIINSKISSMKINLISFNKLIKQKNINIKKTQKFNIKASDDALILFSSGTTSNPKAVVHSSISINEGVFYALDTAPPIKSNDLTIANLPAFHIFGFTLSIHIAFAVGGKCILVPRFNKENYAKLIIEKKPTYLAGVPFMISSFLKSKYLKKALKQKKVDFSNLREFFCGGDFLNPKIKNKFNNLIKQNNGKGRIILGYGLTESCPVTRMPPKKVLDIGIGKPFSGVNIKIIDSKTLKQLPYDKKGEICINSKSVMKYYYKDIKLTKQVLKKHKDGKIWFHTKDLGFLDKKGYLHFCKRMTSEIKINGNTISLDEVQDILLKSSLISKVYVTSIKDKELNIKIKVFIVLKNKKPNQLIKKQILNYCKKTLPKYAIPKIIEFCDKIPSDLINKE